MILICHIIYHYIQIEKEISIIFSLLCQKNFLGYVGKFF